MGKCQKVRLSKILDSLFVLLIVDCYTQGMLIGIDGNEANVGSRVGIGEYAYELLIEFYKLREKGQTDIKFTIYLKDAPLSDMPKTNSWWNYIIVKPYKLWTQIGLPFYLFTHFPRPDVFFTPSHYSPRFSPVPTVIAIMDLSYVHFPHLFAASDLYQLKNWTAYSARQATRIVTISNASKNDILSVYKKKSSDVSVTYLGIKEDSRSKKNDSGLNMEELKQNFGITNKYILFVGTLQPRKNITRLIEAMSLLENKEVQLVIVGKKGWLYEEILAAPEKFGVSNRVKFLDFVDNEDLPDLYKHAEVFVLPSLYEGFGLPVLEAMKEGCPVITSNVSSLPEAGGDAALYVDPENTQDIAKKIDIVLSDEKLRTTMIKKGYAHIKNFSWEKTAKETLNILEEVAKKAK